MRGIVPMSMVLAAACGAGPTSLQLSWLFADGRDCANAGVSKLVVQLDGAPSPLVSFACADGLSPASVTANLPDAAATLQVEAQSPQEAALYQGVVSPSGAPEVTVTLYATGSR